MEVVLAERTQSIDLFNYVQLPQAPIPLIELTNYLEQLQDSAKLEKPPLRKIVKELTAKFQAHNGVEDYLSTLPPKAQRNALAAIMIDEVWISLGKWIEDNREAYGLGYVRDGNLLPISSKDLELNLKSINLPESMNLCREGLLAVINHHTAQFLTMCDQGARAGADGWIDSVYDRYKLSLLDHQFPGLRTPLGHVMSGFTTAIMLNISAVELVINLMSKSIYAKSYSVTDFEEVSEPMFTLMQYLSTSHLNVTGALAFAFKKYDSSKGFQFSPEAFTLLDRDLENPVIAVPGFTIEDFRDRLGVIDDVRTGCPAAAVTPQVVSVMRSIIEIISSKILWPKAGYLMTR